MNAAILQKKVLGLPVWAVGGLGASGILLYHFLHKSGVGGAQAGTTAATGTGDVATGDPVPADAGVFPQTFPSGNGATPGSGVDTSGISDALTGLADAFGNQPQQQDYSAQFDDLNATIGTLKDQQATDHAADRTALVALAARHDTAATKAKTVHAKADNRPAAKPHVAVSHGGRAAPAKPKTHATHSTPTHPKASVKHPKQATKRK